MSMDCGPSTGKSDFGDLEGRMLSVVEDLYSMMVGHIPAAAAIRHGRATSH